MADIDLKTETPDTTLPATGFLFGADSQASASPSVYSTQAVATTLLGSTTLSGTTITASAPVVDFSQTWNNAAVTFTGAKLNITDTASNAASLLMDLQVGGVSFGSLAKNGTLTAGRYAASGFSGMQFNASTGVIGLSRSADGAAVTSWNGNSNSFNAGTVTASATLVVGGSSDLLLTRRGAANLRLGAADAAAPVAQTLSVQSVVAGTTNTAGTNFTFTGSQGTGTGAGGSLIFQVAPAGTAGSTPNALATALTIGSDLSTTFAGTLNGPSSGGFVFSYAGSSRVAIGASGSSSYLAVRSDGGFVFSSTSAPSGTPDVLLFRDAANTLALRNGTAAQTFNVYNTFTDASNYEVGQVSWSTNVFTIATSALGTGTARNLVLRWSTGASITLANNSMTFSSGNLLFGTDGNRDIGSVSASRPANIYAHTAITPGRGVVVASLPTPATGMIARVTDATAPTIGTTVVGGGAAYALVNYNGANWTVIGV
jgi:hypothetical protein